MNLTAVDQFLKSYFALTIFPWWRQKLGWYRVAVLVTEKLVAAISITALAIRCCVLGKDTNLTSQWGQAVYPLC